MTFLNPLVLFGLAAAAIPLIIHLFNFRRPKKVDFSSLAFLKELQKTTMQRVRIKQWLLLALRTLALACLILAFARPTLQGSLSGALGGRARSSVAVVVDNSLSMSLRDAQGGYLEQAKAWAAGVVDQTAPGDEVFVLTTGDQGGVAPSAYSNRGPALQAVADVQLRPGSAPLTRTLARAAALLEETAHPNREVYLLSDLQRSTFADSAAAGVPAGVRTFLLPVGERTHANVAVTDVRVESRIIEVGQPVRIEATLVNYGREPVEDYVASVFLEGERVAQAAADLAPGAPATLTFTATPQRRGWLAGVVQIEDDDFEHDNQRFFTVNVPEQRNILVVRGEGQQTDYIDLALSPRLAEGRIAFALETIPESNLAATALGGYDALVLVGPRDLSSGEVAALTRYVDQGGGLLLFPSAGAVAEDYNLLLDSLGAGRFSGFSGSLGSGRSIAAFDRVDREHPLFEGVFDRQRARAGAQVESPDVYHAMNYTPESGAEQTLIRLSNGFPFLQEVRHGQGAAFLMAVAPDERWSDLPVRGLFVPLLYRSMYYLSAGEAAGEAALVVGQPGELRLAGVGDAEPLRLRSPEAVEFTPEQRTLFGAVLLQFNPAMLPVPGIYEVYAGTEPVRRLAVNLDSRESDLQPMEVDAAVEQLEGLSEGAVQVLEAGDVAGVVQAIQEARTGVELWNVFLLLALTFLVIEMLVVKHWRPEAVAA